MTTSTSNPQHPSISHHGHTDRHCPVCNSILSPFLFNGIEVDICNTHECGIWFDAGELNAIEKSDTLDNIDKAFAGEFKPSAVQSQLENAERLSPVSGKPMERYEWNVGSGIVLDRCPESGGIWMDSGELEGYAEVVKQFHANPPELSEALKGKLSAVELESDLQFNKMLNSITHNQVKWDAWLFDDALRALIAKTIKPFV